MAPRAIISYDDTLNDHDALALGRVLADAGAELTLAYVRHFSASERAGEQLAEDEAHALLERGARLLGDLDVARRVVHHASTGEGLRWLAQSERADIVVFGSDYRTAPGHVAPQRSAALLLEGGRVAVAIAPAEFRFTDSDDVAEIGVLTQGHDHAAIETAHELAQRLDARVVDRRSGVDLLVVGSRPEAKVGQVLVSALAMGAIEEATSPVLVVARETPVRFALPLYVS
jgi:nucleotide-binding universal stress UspA family protein